MKIVAKPKAEQEVLLPVEEEANAEDVLEGIVSRGDCCIDHLCGCNCNC